jgi:tetratricopeptide (TPR) repeat protein
VLRGARLGRELEEATALAELEARLFRRHARPMLRRYRLLRRIGAGGIGVVYAAHDPELQREVAVKLLQPRGEGDHLERLVREGRLLARVTHPNVVAVFDVGRYGPGDLQGSVSREVSAQGAFVVMELVEGVDLRQWLGQRPRTTEQILDKFLAAGRGLAAAHAQGIVHRDFKPGNVLIGDAGEVKVVDFGLARSTSDPASTDAVGSDVAVGEAARGGCVTATGMVLGTPAYMAPEQHRGAAVDERADQYSFCASLVEALYGTRLFTGPDLRAGETRTIGRMPREPVAIPSFVRRALDRGLDPDPARRFASMQALLHAMEPSRWKRSLRRVDVLSAGAGGVAAIVLTISLAAAGGEQSDPCASAVEGRAGSLWNDARVGAVRAALSRASLDPADRDRVVERLDAWATQWASEATYACAAVGPERASDPTSACLTRHASELDALLGLLEQADAQLAAHALDAVLGLPETSRCRTARREDLSDDPATANRVWERLARVAALQAAGRFEPALAEARRARAIAEGSTDANLRATARVREAYLLERTGQSEDARRLLDETYFHAVEQGAHLAAARAAGVRIAAERGRVDEARRWAGSGRAALERAGGDPATSDMIDANLAIVLLDAGEAGEAEPLLRRVLDGREVRDVAPDWRTATHRADLGLALLQLGRLQEAQVLLQSALELRREQLGDDHPDVGASWERLSQLADAQGDLEAALRHGRRALEVYVAAFGDEHPTVAGSMANVAHNLIALQRYDEALDVLLRAMAIFEANLPADHPHLDLVRVAIGQCWAGLGRVEAARAILRSSREAIGAREGYDHPAIAVIDGEFESME